MTEQDKKRLHQEMILWSAKSWKEKEIDNILVNEYFDALKYLTIEEIIEIGKKHFEEYRNFPLIADFRQAHVDRLENSKVEKGRSRYEKILASIQVTEDQLRERVNQIRQRNEERKQREKETQVQQQTERNEFHKIKEILEKSTVRKCLGD